MFRFKIAVQVRSGTKFGIPIRARNPSSKETYSVMVLSLRGSTKLQKKSMGSSVYVRQICYQTLIS
jgi:hypothetical protein